MCLFNYAESRSHDAWTGALGGIKTSIRAVEGSSKPIPQELLAKKSKLEKQMDDYNQEQELIGGTKTKVKQ